jgi:hypothetical protein
MKRIGWSVLIGILLLTACGQATAVPVIPSVTLTPSIPPTSTQTALPSATPTASITPLPTIPTFTPTFDVSTILTVTPAPQAECPKEDPSVIAKFATPDSNGFYEMYGSTDMLDYLNSGGTLAQLEKIQLGASWEKFIDLTGDGLNEVIFKGLAIYSILGCTDGQYQDLFDFAGDSGANLAEIIDLNKNGIPEIILYNVIHYGYAYVSIFEWDGTEFRSLIDLGTGISSGIVIDEVSATVPHKITDTIGDGLNEIVIVYDVNQLCGGFGDFCDGTPARAQTTVLQWNGRNYVLQQGYYTPAEYRFQAIQDGDAASLQKKYDQALSFYQEAIFSDKLKSYSPEIQDNLRAQFYNQYGTTPTPTPHPIAVDEYPKLASYAYYRILLLHLVQNHESDARTVYNSLQQKFRNDQYGHPYAEMATAFWEAYQSAHKMYDGCAAAIQYAVEHPEILTPLGSDYHGSQAKIYKPEDVCPFR